jgi:hypothetical protein
MSNVKKILSIDLEERTIEFLSKFVLSNDELLEVFELTSKKWSTAVTQFLSRLIDSQKGPFDKEVVTTYMNEIAYNRGAVTIIFPLIRKADKNISEDIKYTWLIKAKRILPNVFEEFVNSGEAAELGFDLTKEPWDRASKRDSKLQIIFSNNTFTNEQLKILFDYFDTINEDELFDFYLEVVRAVNYRKQFMIWFNYPKTTAKIIEHYIEKIFQADLNNAIEMAKHPNCTNDIKMEMFKKTDDPYFLPDDILTLFHFE